MSAEWITALAGICLVLVTAFGFVFVNRQIRASSVDHLYGRMQDIHKLLIDKPELRQHIFNTQETSVEQFSDEALAISEMMADFFQQVFLELDHFPPTAAAGWRCYMKDTLKRSPALQNFVISRSEWYPTDFVTKLLSNP